MMLPSLSSHRHSKSFDVQHALLKPLTNASGDLSPTHTIFISDCVFTKSKIHQIKKDKTALTTLVTMKHPR